MALAPVQLDDLTWTEMVESVRRRIPGASHGLWTLHAPVDPGITLLELFAWLIEQRLFWIDQVPDQLTRALFALLSERTADAQPAATVLACDPPQAAPFHELPPGVEFSFRSVEADRTFTTRTGAVLAPVSRVSLRTGAGDRTADLKTRKPIPLLGNDGAASEFVLVFWFSTAAPLPATQEKLSTLFDLETFGRIAPEWVRDAGPAVAPPSELVWSYSIGPGTWRDFNGTDVEDGTGGLRRSGLVRLPMRSDWAPMQPVAGAEVPRAIRVRTERATYTVPPQLLGLASNAVIADHWNTVTLDAADAALQASNWLRLPGEQLQLVQDAAPPISRHVELRLRERDDSYPWIPVDDFAFADRSSRVFVVNRTARTIRFGDGVWGRIPVPHDPLSPEIELRYRAGAGLAGNLAPHKTWHATHAGVAVQARNPVAASGGAEPETIPEASRRIAGRLRGQQRAVTREDFEALARSTPGVAIGRALAVVGLHPLHPCAKTPGAVTVFVVPFAPRPDIVAWTWPDRALVAAPVIDPGALAEVQVHLERARLITSQVFVRPTTLRAVSLRIELIGTPADPRGIERRLGARLSRFLDPLEGGDTGEGLPFGEPVRPSGLLRVAQQALLGEIDVAQVSVGLDESAPSENCRDVEIGPYQLPYLRRLTVLSGALPSSGGLP